MHDFNQCLLLFQSEQVRRGMYRPSFTCTTMIFKVWHAIQDFAQICTREEEERRRRLIGQRRVPQLRNGNISEHHAHNRTTMKPRRREHVQCLILCLLLFIASSTGASIQEAKRFEEVFLWRGWFGARSSSAQLLELILVL